MAPTPAANSATDVVAVLDLGKTNKKVVLINRALRVIEERSMSLPAQVATDGLLEEDTDGITDFLKTALHDLSTTWTIRGIGLSCHGGTWAGIAADGSLAGPVIAYDSAVADQAQLDTAFYELQDAAAAQAETGTCDLPLLINPAKSIFALQQFRPEQASKTTAIQHYPAFWAGKLCGQAVAERTYALNHSYLHRIPDATPSTLAAALGIQVPEKWADSWAIAGALTEEWQANTGLGPIPVGVGLHDSNAALLPYLIDSQREDDFALLSTGTWCVGMHAVPTPTYAVHEIGSKIIFNVDALGGWQKVSFLMGGQDYALYHELIGGDHINEADPAEIDHLLANTDGILPGASASLFPGCAGDAFAGDQQWSLEQLRSGDQPSWWSDSRNAHHLLNISLALQAAYALQCTDINATTAIYVEGGFRHNGVFLNVLAAQLAPRPVYCTDIGQASALGAGIAVWAGTENVHPSELGEAVRIERTPVSPPALKNLAGYAKRLYARAGVTVDKAATP
jgi:sugar (pentulose or hexulose) kinase